MLVKDLVNEIAREIYRMMGSVVREGYDFKDAYHPQERLCWRIACMNYEKITGDYYPNLDNEWAS